MVTRSQVESAKAKAKGSGSKVALAGEQRVSDWVLDPHDCLIIGLDTKDGPDHPLWDPRVNILRTMGRAAVADMITSILANGYLQNISVRKDGGRIETGIGRSRVFAGRFILDEKLRPPPFKVPAALRYFTDAQWRDAIIAENAQRTDSDALTEALAMANWLRFNPSREALCKVAKMSMAELDRCLAVATMPEPVQAKIIQHRLGRAVVEELAGISRAKQEQTLDNLLGQGLVTLRTVRAEATRVAAEEAPAGAAEGRQGTDGAGAKEKPPAGPRRPSAARLEKLLKAAPRVAKPMSDEAICLLRYVVEGDGEWVAKVPGLTDLMAQVDRKPGKKGAAT